MERALVQIFIEHGFDLQVIGSEKPKQCLKRWRKTFNQFGEDGFLRNGEEKVVLEDHHLNSLQLRKA
ncbi:hypothetical protein J7E81_24580 [Bacillus sp. ISL-18]|uniref:hypothetical protein n=1 Tax=Bacillus sp. ISL-18 TaxID=2819118 RepID=UPI001BEA393D|nr:hypothetical protein [Bacillus sp. ISL-18]MBT2658364.1 hypothetical protein [Bacillus sp. ISL-18]